MLFTSAVFLFLFTPAFLFVFWNCTKAPHAKRLCFILFSLTFYAYADIRTVPLLLFSIGVNWLFSKKVMQSRAVFIGAICFNLIFLGFFKYTPFVIENVNALFSKDFSLCRLIVPLGISFFTFVQIAALNEIRHGEVRVPKFDEYVAFVSFFPQISAGPIVSLKEMMPQYERQTSFSWKEMYAALILFIIGFVKKKMADNYAFFVGNLYDADEITFFWAWCGAFSYAFQLYFDFSGYCDMGRAVAMVVGIRLPVNFDSPYKATSIQDFWRRWHITLSSWLKNYLYIPLGGSRKGTARTLLNLFLIMFLGGLWHGAGWTFVLWGATHGIALGVCRLWKMWKKPLPHALAWVLTFLFVTLAWVFFRSENVFQAYCIFSEMFFPKHFALPEWIVIRKYVPIFLIGIICTFCSPNSQTILVNIDLIQRKTFFKATMLVVFGLYAFIQANSAPVFIYFRF